MTAGVTVKKLSTVRTPNEYAGKIVGDINTYNEQSYGSVMGEFVDPRMLCTLQTLCIGEGSGYYTVCNGHYPPYPATALFGNLFIR